MTESLFVDGSSSFVVNRRLLTIGAASSASPRQISSAPRVGFVARTTRRDAGG
jgi:hypothetical protein